MSDKTITWTDTVAQLQHSSHPVRSLATRLLHGSILCAVLYQLIGSSFLSRPIPGEALDLPTQIHEYVGLGSMALVLAFWGWTLVRRGETSLGRLVPWFQRARRQAVLADLQAQARQLMRLQVPSDDDGALASAIHGLGLLTLSAMAISGTIYFALDSGTFARTALSLHKLMANLMWAYLIGHASLAVLHHAMGSDILSRMFWRGSRPAR